LEGVSRGEVAFASRSNDDFTNESGYGASGWMLKPEGFNPLLESMDEADSYCEAGLPDDVDLDSPEEEREELTWDYLQELAFGQIRLSPDTSHSTRTHD